DVVECFDLVRQDLVDLTVCHFVIKRDDQIRDHSDRCFRSDILPIVFDVEHEGTFLLVRVQRKVCSIIEQSFDPTWGSNPGETHPGWDYGCRNTANAAITAADITSAELANIQSAHWKVVRSALPIYPGGLTDISSASTYTRNVSSRFVPSSGFSSTMWTSIIHLSPSMFSWVTFVLI